MYIVDTSRNLQQDEAGAVQAQSLHYRVWPGLLTISLLHMSCTIIYGQLWTGWCEDTWADSERLEQHFWDSALDPLHLYCLHSAHMQKCFICKLDNLLGHNGKETKNTQST